MGTKKRDGIWTAAGIVLIAVTALLMMLKVPFIYTVNDDLFMKNILSGAYLGTPDVHAVYMEYPLCFMLSGLYRLAAGVPWYGICFFLFHCIGWGVIFGRIGVKKRMGAAFALLLFTACGFYHVASMQFTVTAAVLGAAALVWFYTSDFGGSVKHVFAEQSVTVLLVFLSFNVRRNVLLMLLPFAGMLWLRRWFAQPRQERFSKGIILKYAGTALLCLAVTAVTMLSYLAAYGSADWKDYITYNDNATVLYDYYAWPEYEENRELYDELGISYEGYQGAKEAYLLSVNNGIDEEAMVRLAERSEMLHQNSASIGSKMAETVKIIGKRSFSEIDRPLNLIVLMLYALIFLFIVINRKWQALYSVGAVLIGRMFSWIYIVYEGRYPVRITQSLFLAEAAVLLVIFFTECLKEEREERKLVKAGKISVLCGFALLLVFFSYTRLRHVYRENSWRLEESRDLQSVQEYCGEHMENFYFVDSKSISGDTERIFDTKGSGFENYIVFGGWLSGSPVYGQKVMNAGIDDVEDALLNSGRVYAVFENSEACPTAYLEQYFASEYKNFSMQAVESFGRNQNQFQVYELRAEGLYE